CPWQSLVRPSTGWKNYRPRRSVSDLFVIPYHHAATGFFGELQKARGLIQLFINVAAQPVGDSRTEIAAESLVLYGHRFRRDQLTDLADQGYSLIIIQTRQQLKKFISARATQQKAPQHLLQQFRYVLQNLVAALIASTLGDLSEVINIEHGQCQRRGFIP